MNAQAPRKRGGVGRADLLQVLDALAKLAESTRLADFAEFADSAESGPQQVRNVAALRAEADPWSTQALRFYKEKARVADLEPARDAVAIVGAAASAPFAAPLAALPPARAPLRAPLFGITEATSVARKPVVAAPPRQPLRSEEYQPRVPGRPRALPLIGNAALMRRAHTELARREVGAALDIDGAVKMLAEGGLPTRWPRRAGWRAPAHVSLVVDRSLRLTPYVEDQNRLFLALCQWLGEAHISTCIVQDDPFRPSAAASSGHPQRNPSLEPGRPGGVVLLLTDMGQLRTGAPDASALARWTRAARHLGRHGARVLVCPPFGAAPTPAGWPASLARFPAPSRAVRTAWVAGAAGAGGTAGDGDRADDAKSAASAQQKPEPALDRLLMLLACARQIEPALVRALRRLDPSLAGAPALEGLLWSNRPEFSTGRDVMVWRPEAAAAYRQWFGAEIAPAMQRAVMQAMLDIHASAGRLIAVQELLVWSVHVAPATAEAFTEQIAEARDWLLRFPLRAAVPAPDAVRDPERADRQAVGRILIAQQTTLAQWADRTLFARYPDLFGPLWGIADREARLQGHQRPAPGALPVALLHGWSEEGADALETRRYQLVQNGQRIVLAANAPGDGEHRSPLGMALSVGALVHEQFTMPPRGTGGGQQLVHPAGAAVVLGAALPQRGWQVRTDAVSLTVGDIAVPFPCVERGRDACGLYADFTVASTVGGPPVRARMRYIEAGQFMMGSPEGEAGRYEDEGPVHSVTISRGFWLADTACTQALWLAVMGENPSRFKQADGKGGSDLPVENVSSSMVNAFMKKLQILLPGCLASLPTEAEWEYACRAGGVTPFSFGATVDTGQVNFDGTHPAALGRQKGKDRQCTVAVKALPANAWGLYQMHGNVWEWCADVFQSYTADPVVDPGLRAALDTDPTGNVRRVLRGGAWRDAARYARSACRSGYEPAWRFDGAGFRLALRSIGQASRQEA